jgi:cytosine/adenosine deaminase-related metal-dependent hydrolase
VSERILVRGGHLIPGDGPELPDTDLLIEDGAIAAIGPALPADGSRIIEAGGLVVLPGFVDGHRHVWQAPLRGIGVDLTLGEYLEVVLDRALFGYRPEDARLACLLGAVEALDAGITTVFDWSNCLRTPAHTDAVVEAYREAGVRAVVAHGNASDQADVRRLAALTGTVTGAVASFGPRYTPWEQMVSDITLARSLGTMISMHARGGAGSATERLYAEGLLGPDIQLVHVNGLTADEAKILVDTGTAVVATPVVEGTMGHGTSVYGAIRDAGGRTGLGTDVVVNAPTDLFEPMRDTLRTERLRTGSMPPAASFLSASTVDSARMVGLADVVGTLAVGKRADVVLLDGLGHLTGGPATLAGAVVASSMVTDVHTVLVDGRVVKENGRLAADLASLRASGYELAHRVL